MSSLIGGADVGGGDDEAVAAGQIPTADVGAAYDDTTVSPTAFAAVCEVANAWRPIQGTLIEMTRLLLDAAGFWIRRRKPGVLDSDPAAKIVSILVVRHRIEMDKFRGAHTGSHTVGARTDSWAGARTASIEQLADDLVFAPSHRTMLGLNEVVQPVAGFGSISRGPDPIQPWVPESWDPGWGWGYGPPYS